MTMITSLATAASPVGRRIATPAAQATATATAAVAVAVATPSTLAPALASTPEATPSFRSFSTERPPRAPSISTRITDLFGCEHPIVLPGMSWISTPELVAAVSNAGGVGILATGPLSACETRASIRRVRSLLRDPDLPFGIGATLLMPGAHENAGVALEEEVPVVNVSLGKAGWIRDGLDAYGGKLLATVTNRVHAAAAVESGADALMATGHEAAAHGGDVTSLVLVPALAGAFPETPLVAAGGFCDGRGLNAALVLGADAVAMGTRMAVTEESPLAGATKEAIVTAGEAETIYGDNFDGIPARVLATDASAKAMGSRPLPPVVAYRAFCAARGMGIPLWKVLPGLLTQWNKMYAVAQFGAATEAIVAATVGGDVAGKGVQFAGQCQGLIHDVPGVEDLVRRVVEESLAVQRAQAERHRRWPGGTHHGGDYYPFE
ncbi:unnamed protein product [Pseudo-nitzschia multistriata]|uniref:Nitronate monooxygenase domain-containing protein n=1 Tax=Pseudo-nitzschia multistriata TaxID=183589 RepID=A0A448ZJG9_9STRA|nr:unnamed protein product [Pseudo-nitzschia multistriata]